MLVRYLITPSFAFTMQNEIKYGSKGKSLALRLKSPVKTTRLTSQISNMSSQYPISIQKRGIMNLIF